MNKRIKNKIKRVIGSLMALSVASSAFSAFSVSAWASEGAMSAGAASDKASSVTESGVNLGDLYLDIDKGSCGDSLVWEVTKGSSTVLTISGDGVMDDYAQEAPPWNSYADSVDEIIIEEGVSSIGACAFSGFKSLVRVTISEGTESIGDRAFMSCENLENIYIPSTVTSIGVGAFKDCLSLAGVYYSGTEEEWNTVAVADDNSAVDDAVKYFGAKAEDVPPLPVETPSASGEPADTDEPEAATGSPEPSPAETEAHVLSDSEDISGYTVPETAESEEAVAQETASGTCGSGLTWVLYDTGLLIINGSGSMDNYSYDNMPWYTYKDRITQLVIEEGVTTIGDCAFYNCKGITGTLTLNEGLTTIGDYAFYNCKGITGTLMLNEGLTTIGYRAFSGCSGMTGDLVIPDSVTSMEPCAFESCSGFDGKLQLSEGLTTIEISAFIGCSGITGEIEIPDNVKTIGYYAFRGMKKAESVRFGTGISSIGGYAFEGCSGIKELCFTGTTVPNLSNGHVLTDMTSLETIYVPQETYSAYVSAYEGYVDNGIKITVSVNESDFVIQDGVLLAYTGAGGEVEIPAGVTEIGSAAFQNNTEITKVTFNSGLTKINAYAFQNCTGLKEIGELPEGLTDIGEYAFSGSGIEGALTIPKTVTTIDNYAFYNCTGITGTLTLNEGLTTIGYSAFCGCSGITGDLVIPDSVTSMEPYAFTNCSGFNGKLKLSEGLTTIGYSAFCGCSGITGALLIPNKVQTIESYAFEGCNGIKELCFTGTTVPSLGNSNVLTDMTSLETIYVPQEAYSAYVSAYAGRISSGTRITVSGNESDFVIQDGVLLVYTGAGGEVEIPAGVTEIGRAAFQNNTEITKVTFNSGLTKINTYAFQNCTGLKEIGELPEGLTEIGDHAFSGSGIEGVLTIPKTVTTIGDYAFQNCKGISGLAFNEGLSSIGIYAFQNCTGITGDLVMPSTLVSIGNYAFYNCTGMMGTLTLNEGLTTIGNSAFRGCSGMTGDLVIPDSVTSMGSSTFESCSGFNGKLKLSEGLTEMGSYTFFGCSGITGEIEIPDSVKTIWSYAFYKMKKAESVRFGTGVSSIEGDAFYGCSGIKELCFTGTTVPSLGNSNVLKNMTSLETIYVPQEAYSAYVSAYGRYVRDGVVFSTDTLKMPIKNFEADKIYSKTVHLSWSKHGNESVIKYIIERDGEVVGETETNDFTDAGLVTDKTYSYSVYGVTSEGETTPPSTLTVQTAAPKVTDIRTDNAFNKVAGTKNTVYITAENNRNHSALGDSDVSGVLYYVDAEGVRHEIGKGKLTETGSESVTYSVVWDIDGFEDGEYEVVFVITDIDGVSGEGTAVLTVDHTLPERIMNFIALGVIDGISLSWSMSSEVDTDRYRIYRRSEIDTDFYPIKTVEGRNTLSYLDSSVQPDRLYKYYIAGLNDIGLEGPPSDIASAKKGVDSEKPVVTRISPENMSYISGNTSIGVTAEDNVAPVKTEIYRADREADDGWTLIGADTTAPFGMDIDTTALPDGTIQIKALAYDAAGNVSDPLIYTYYVDNTGTEKVSGLEYTSTSVTVTLSWDNVSDEDIRFFRVERKNDSGEYELVKDVYDTLGINITGLTPGTEYTYRVVGYDHLGNRGEASDDITVKTQADTTAPVITGISPKAGYYSSMIPIRITAEDDYAVRSVAIEWSRDNIMWTRIHEQSFTDLLKSRTVSYDLALDGYEEGELYIRGAAADAGGNISDNTAAAPFVQYIVDKTAPAAPAGVSAAGGVRYIEVKWDKGTEQDLSTYSVYRSEAPSEEYSLVADGLSQLNYIDTNVELSKSYCYKIAVKDRAGNRSEFSDVVTASTVEDTEAPRVVSIYPAEGETLGVGYRTVSVYAADDQLLDSILIEYSHGGGMEYKTLRLFENVRASGKTVAVSVPIEEFDNGDTVLIRVTATDMAGTSSDIKETSYIIDRAAPSLTNAAAVYEEGSVILSWKGDNAADLIGYRIYRKTDGGSYSLIGQKSAESGTAEYMYTDRSIAYEKHSYTYRIDAVDNSGNTAGFETNAVQTPDRSAPTAVISCDAVMEVGVEYEISGMQSADNSQIASYSFDLGDGTLCDTGKVVHAYSSVGTYTIKLIVTDDDGNTSEATKTVEVRERTLLGTAKIRVVDAYGKPVSGASVYFDLGTDDMSVKTTDSSGYVTFTAAVGVYEVGCFISDNDHLPAKSTVTVTAGETAEKSLTLVQAPLIEGSFEIERMTFDEIVAAGIDVSKPENQYMVNIDLKLTYGTEDVDVSFRYNETTKEVISRPTVITTETGEKREIKPIVIAPSKGAHTGGDDGYEFSKDMSVAILDIPVGVSTLKDFFNVRLHIINNASSEFSMLENSITLNVPDGLTVMDSLVSESGTTVNIPEIKGQDQETITWILRGDKVGEYYISADYIGILSQFNETVTARFEAEKPIEVLGMQGLTLQVDIANELDHGSLYYNVSLVNNSDREIYRPNITTGDILIESEWFDANGNIFNEKMSESGINVNMQEYNASVSVVEFPDVLGRGERVTRHYISIDQTEYTESKMELLESLYTSGEAYGLEVKITDRDPAFFEAYLDINVNTAAKADAVLNENRDAYEYLKANQGFIYWNMFMSNGGTELVGDFGENAWDVVKILSGDEGLSALLSSEDKEQVEALLIEIMRITAEDTEDSAYAKTVDFLKEVKSYAEKFHADDLGKYGFDKIGDMIAHTYEIIYEKYSWEFYQCVVKEQTMEMGEYILTKIDMTEEYELFEETSIEIKETAASSFLHDMFSSEGFSTVWKAIGFTLDAVKILSTAYEGAEQDLAIYIKAQSTIDACNIFLDTILTSGLDKTDPIYTMLSYSKYLSLGFFGAEQSYKYFTGADEGKLIIDAAKDVKKTINDYSAIGSYFSALMSEAAQKLIDEGGKKAVKALYKYIPSAYAQAIKASLKISVAVGDNVFNVSERFDVADNIRFLSFISMAALNGMENARQSYISEQTEESALVFMQLVQSMIEIRRIGESQAAQYGKTFEVIEGVWDSRELLESVNNISGTQATSWNAWRDIVEDKLVWAKIQLLHNPVQKYPEGQEYTAPQIWFDYMSAQLPALGSQYEYSINNGEWISYADSPVTVKPSYSGTIVSSRKKETDTSDNEKLVARMLILPIPSIDSQPIAVKSSDAGYIIQGLDPDMEYELTFSNEAEDKEYDAELEMSLPLNVSSYEIASDSEYKYMYIRSKAKTNSFASMVKRVEITPAVSMGDVNLDGHVNPGDAVAILRYIAGLEEIGDEGIAAADVTGDGSVNPGDAVKLLQYCAGLIDNL